MVGASRPVHALAMSDVVETDRLVLRHFTADGAELLIELDSDPAVMRYLTGGEPTLPPAVVREQVIPSVLATYERWNGRFGLFAAYERHSGDFIGWFQLRPEREGPLDEVELGYRLRQDAWGKGYATEAARALLDKGFSELGLGLVWGETMAVKPAVDRLVRPGQRRGAPRPHPGPAARRRLVPAGPRRRHARRDGDARALPAGHDERPLHAPARAGAASRGRPDGRPAAAGHARLRSMITTVAVSVAVRDAKEEPPEPGRPL